MNRNWIRIGLFVLVAAFASCGSPVAEPAAKEKYTRVLPTNAAAVDLVFDLIGSSNIAAVPRTVDEFANVTVDPVQFTANKRFGQFSAEVLLAFEPDLVVVSPWQGRDTVERLREAGVRVVELRAVQSFDDLRRGIAELGEILDANTRASELLREFDANCASLSEAAEARKGQTAICYTNYGSGGWVAGQGTTANMVLELAGLTNLAAEAGRTGHDTVDIESLLTWDPDWIVVSKPSEAYGVTRSYLEGEEALAGLRAITENRIIEIPAALYSTTSHFLVGAAEALDVELDDIRAIRPR